MEPVKVAATFSPHFSGGKPRGFYVVVNRLFPRGTPILRRKQFLGFNGNLIVTVSSYHAWDTVLKMNLQMPRMHDRQICWLEEVPIYTTTHGFRIYVPGNILKPEKRDKIESSGVFRHAPSASGESQYDVLYMEFPKVTSKILLGEEPLR